VRLMLISADCHASPLQTSYTNYLEKQYLPDLEDALKANDHQMAGVRAASGGKSRGQKSAEELKKDMDRRALFAIDLGSRIEPLEAEGFVGEVIFPDGGADNEIPFTGLFGCPGDFSLELYAAGLRAYNRWLEETAAPGRQVGLALIPMHDPEYAVQQAKSARSDVTRGILLSWDGIDPRFRPLSDPCWDELWSVCADNDLPVHSHLGSGLPTQYARAENLISSGTTTSNPLALNSDWEFWCRRPLWHMIWGGVFDRHPGLKFVFAEAFVDWIPRTLKYMDWQFEWRKHDLKRRPSEYWRQNFYACATTPSVLEHQMRHELGLNHFLYGTDFPHGGSSWGVSNEYLQATMMPSGYNEIEAQAVLGGNAVQLYHLDPGQLQPIADRVGPTLDQVLSSPTGVDPRITLASKSPRLRYFADRPHSLL
jgi:predicted TIM-barrel fold metal-dependent hydrolase